MLNSNNETIFYRELGKSLYDNLFIYNEKRKFGIQTYDFEVIIPAIYKEIKPAFKNHFWARNSHKWFLYNFSNQRITDQPFTIVNSFNMKFARVSTDGENFGFINRNGDVVISEKYLGGMFLGLDYFAVSILTQNGLRFGVIALSGNIIYPFTLKTMPTFSEIVLYVLKRRKPLREWLQL